MNLIAMYMVFAGQAIEEKEGRRASREELWKLVTDPETRGPCPPELLEWDRQDREAEAE